MTDNLVDRCAYGYIRVSTHDQEELSPDSQERLLRDYASANHIDLKELFIDAGISGRKAHKRPAFQEMIARAKSAEHPVDVLLVWKFSRFARNQEESIVYKSLLKKAGVEVISVSEPLTEGPFGTLIERIIEWMDEYYSIRLSGEVKRGMLENAIRGNYQTTAPFGYRNGKDALEICPEEADYVRLIFRKFYEEHLGYTGIARHLNALGIKSRRGCAWENRTIKYLLQNPVYKGYARWNVGKEQLRKGDFTSPEIICKRSRHEAIIDETYFDQVQAEIRRQSHLPKSRDSQSYGHWLGNLLKCSSCGSSLTFQKANQGFQCISYGKGKCSKSHFSRSVRIEQAVIDTFARNTSAPVTVYKKIKPKQAVLATEYDLLKGAIEKLKQREKRIRLAYQDGIDTPEEYKENKELLLAERQQITCRMQEIEKQQFSQRTAACLDEDPFLFQGISTLLNSNADQACKSSCIRSICDKITYNKAAETIDIYCFYPSKE